MSPTWQRTICPGSATMGSAMANPFDGHEHRRPDVDTAEAARLLSLHFGREGALRELGSHQDRNFRVDAPDGRYVLKVARQGLGRGELEAENQAMLRAGAAGLPFAVPAPQPAQGRIADRGGGDGGRRAALPPAGLVDRGRAAGPGRLPGPSRPAGPRRDVGPDRPGPRGLGPPGPGPGAPVGPATRGPRRRGAAAVRVDPVPEGARAGIRGGGERGAGEAGARPARARGPPGRHGSQHGHPS